MVAVVEMKTGSAAGQSVSKHVSQQNLLRILNVEISACKTRTLDHAKATIPSGTMSETAERVGGLYMEAVRVMKTALKLLKTVAIFV